MTSKKLTVGDLESARGEIFHMILFAMAWVMIGEFAVDFGDFLLPSIVVVAGVVVLALHSIKLYELEDYLAETSDGALVESVRRKKRFRRYIWIFLFEGGAIMATWMVLLRTGKQDWLVPGFALIAGLHFFPLARAIRLKSYYWLGAWITALALAGYWLTRTGALTTALGNALIAYGCAAGAVADGAWIVLVPERILRGHGAPGTGTGRER
ncbi:MAG TPA: hypothetical protein VN616_14005 [Puia sp.]|nr:hypothetical protein [Puia sp.]